MPLQTLASRWKHRSRLWDVWGPVGLLCSGRSQLTFNSPTVPAPLKTLLLANGAWPFIVHRTLTTPLVPATTALFPKMKTMRLRRRGFLQDSQGSRAGFRFLRDLPALARFRLRAARPSDWGS